MYVYTLGYSLNTMLKIIYSYTSAVPGTSLPGTAVQVFKILNKISPPYLHGIFSYVVDVTGRSGRNLHRLFVPSVRTNYGKQSLAYRGTAIWNRLPKAQYSAKTVNGFKNIILYNVILFCCVCMYLYCIVFFLLCSQGIAEKQPSLADAIFPD